MEIKTYEQPMQLYIDAARFIFSRMEEDRPLAIALPAGNTPKPLYKVFVESHRKGRSFKNVTVFNLDEFCGIGERNASSFANFLRSELLQHLDIPEEQIFHFNGIAQDPKAECQRIEFAIKNAGGIDLCLLGLGLNGHIGFNEPGSALNSRARMVELTQKTRWANADRFADGNVPTHGLTLGLGTIMESREILLLAVGANKRIPVTKCFQSPADPNWPASCLQNHPKTTIMTSF